MRRRGASRLSRCPCCPSRLGFCFPQQKSHTPGQTRCQDDTSTQEAPGSYSPDRGKGYSRDPGNRRWWRRQEAENQRVTQLPLLREPWALHSTLWKMALYKSTCHLPHRRGLASWEEHVLYNSPALPTLETFISTTEKWPWAENHVLNKKNTYFLTSKIA